ncbi:MAG: thioredoxin family protein [Thaumarchaeota archaeon]|nr:MAG: thioredoxin family protein [Nitrososphaerota archaeon]TLX89150.1 MAG: thioredoxin family protein [Nitrososphaerota archaeon]
MEQLQPNQFDRFLSEGKKSLVMFYADWCPFCQKFKPIFESLANIANNNISFYASVINDDDNPLWDRFSINTVPTLIAFDKSNIISRREAKIGHGLSKSEIDSILKEISE